MWLVLGFAALGLLIGNLIGLTAHSVVSSVIGLLFAFGGTSILAFLSKLGQDDRRVAGQCILALSLSCLIGTYGGITASEWHILSPQAKTDNNLSASAGSSSSASRNKYLNSASLTAINAIDTEYRNKAITAEEAYEGLRKAVQ